jgi:hypothetical protein
VYQYRYLQAEIPDTDFPVLTTGLVQRFYINVWTGFLPALHLVKRQSSKLIYGLEVLQLKKKHVENLESFHRKSIRYLQSLPQRIATAAIYLLVGAVPIEAELHKRKLSLLYSMLASDNSKIKEIINRR